MNADVLAANGAKQGTVELPEAVFGRKPAKGIMWESVLAYLANQRQGTASTKTRGLVSGTGKKPYRQKHTGRARHGSRRTPIFVGGGIAWGPKPRDYSLAIPKKKRRQALLDALSARNAEGGVMVVEDFDLGQAKTKELVKFLSALGLAGKVQAAKAQVPGEEQQQSAEGKEQTTQSNGLQRVLLLVAEPSQNLVRASRNVPWLTVMPATHLNAYAVLWHSRVVFTRTGLERFLTMCGGEGRAE